MENEHGVRGPVIIKAFRPTSDTSNASLLSTKPTVVRTGPTA